MFLNSTYNSGASYNDSILDPVKESIQFGGLVLSSPLIKWIVNELERATTFAIYTVFLNAGCIPFQQKAAGCSYFWLTKRLLFDF